MKYKLHEIGENSLIIKNIIIIVFENMRGRQREGTQCHLTTNMADYHITSYHTWLLSFLHSFPFSSR